MFGVMGTSAAFAQAGCAHKQQVSDNYLTFESAGADTVIYQLSCNGTIVIESTKNGESVTATYKNLSNVQVSIQSDEQTEITIRGDVTTLCFSAPFNTGDTNITQINTSNSHALVNLNLRKQTQIYASSLTLNSELEILDLSSSSIEEIDLSVLGCPNLKTLDCQYCENLNSINADQHNSQLTSLLCDSTNIVGITYRAENESVTNAFAELITSSTIGGTLGTDSAGTYYQTLADAVSSAQKHWEITQLN